MVRPRQGQEGAAVVDQATHRDAAEAHPVIALLAPDQPGALALAAGPVIGERDLQRGVHRLRAGVCEEDPVEAGRGDLRQRRGEVEGQRVAHLEGGCVVQRQQLLADGGGDFLTSVAGVDAPKPGHAVEHFAPVVRAVVHALGGDQQPGLGLELPVSGERHPVGVEVRPVLAVWDVVHRRAPLMLRLRNQVRGAPAR